MFRVTAIVKYVELLQMGVVDFHTDAGSQEVSTFQTQGNDQPVEGAHTLVFGTVMLWNLFKYEQLNLALKAKQGLLPNGWTLVDSAEIVLAKSVYVEREQKVVTTFSVVIKEGFCWDVVLPHGVSIPKTSHLFQQQEHLHDVDKVISVLHDWDAPVCVGNGNNKFHALKQWKSGRFLGRSKHRKYVPPPPPPKKINNVILTFAYATNTTNLAILFPVQVPQ